MFLISDLPVSYQIRSAVRISVCVSIALLAGLACYVKMKATAGQGADDFTYYWLAAKAVVEGQNPYSVVQPGGPFNLNAGFLYPLPAALVIAPLTILNPLPAVVLFVSLSSALLAWGITKDGFQRLPIFGSMPFLWAVTSGQFSPLITAAALIPALAFLFTTKPNLGLAGFAGYPSKVAVIGGLVILSVSFLIQPHWPVDWIHSVANRTPGNYGSPLFMLGGPLLLLAVLKWRRPEARLLLLMSIVPQSLLFYDQLILWLIPKTRTESALLGITSYAGWFIASQSVHGPSASMYGPAIVWSIFLPCLAMVLRRH